MCSGASDSVLARRAHFSPTGPLAGSYLWVSPGSIDACPKIGMPPLPDQDCLGTDTVVNFSTMPTTFEASKKGWI